MKTYKCQVCDYTAKTQGHLKQHNNSAKHKRNVNGEKKELTDYFCACCNYTTYYKYAYNKHMKTAKHRQNAGEVIEKKPVKDDEDDKEVLCQFCYKKLKNSESLRRHQERYRKYNVYKDFIFATTMMVGARKQLEDMFLKHGTPTGVDAMKVYSEKLRIVKARIKKEQDPKIKKRLEQQLEHIKSTRATYYKVLMSDTSEKGIDDGTEPISKTVKISTKKDYAKKQRQEEMIPRTLYFNGKEHKMLSNESGYTPIAEDYMELCKESVQVLPKKKSKKKKKKKKKTVKARKT